MSRSISVIAIVRRTSKVYFAQASLLLPPAVCLAGLLRILDVMPIKHSRVLALLILLAILIAVTLFTGVVVQIVADAREGSSVLSFRAALRTVRPVLALLLLVGIVAGIAITLLSFVGPLVTLSLLIGVALGVTHGFAHLGGILVIGLATNVLLVAAAWYLILSWSIAAPVVVLERPHGLDALARSRTLVRHNRWRIFGTLLLFGVPLGIVGRLVELGGVSAGKVPAVASEILVATLILPVPLIVVAVIYFELLTVNGGAPISIASTE
jgi:hypothetical protein